MVLLSALVLNYVRYDDAHAEVPDAPPPSVSCAQVIHVLKAFCSDCSCPAVAVKAARARCRPQAVPLQSHHAPPRPIYR
eukprot:6208112-Pleurochrysis_carterae.AAC.1